MLNKKIGVLLTSIALISTLTVGCGSKNNSSNSANSVTVSGSTSVGPLIEKEG